MKIVEENGKFCLYNVDGNKLGEYDTEEEAKKAIAAMMESDKITESKFSFTRAVRLLASTQPEGKEFEVVLIEAGPSKNKEPFNFNYSEELLSKSAALFEGTKAYAYEKFEDGKHVFDHLPIEARKANPQGFPKNLVGWYDNVRFGEFRREDNSTGKGLLARFHIAASWLRDLMKNSWDAGKKNLLEFSIDADGKIRKAVDAAGNAIKDVLQFDKVDEVTVVTDAAAGGRILRMIASKQKESETKSMDAILKWLREKFPKLVESVKDDDAVEAKQTAIMAALDKILESVKAGAAAGNNNGGQAAGGNDGADNKPLTAEAVQEMIRQVSADAMGKFIAERDAESAKTKAAQAASDKLVEDKLKESKLPEPTQKKIRKQLEGKLISEGELMVLLKDEQDALAALQEAKLYVPGQERFSEATINKDQVDKYNDAFLGMLMNRPINKQQPFKGIHHSYREITGYSGSASDVGHRVLRECAIATSPLNIKQEVWNKMLRESRQGINARMQEDTLTTTLWAEVYGDSVRRAMIMFYFMPKLQEWRRVVSSIVPIPDFRTNRRQRVGGFSNLDIVAQGGTYQEKSWPADEEATYAVRTRGNLFPLTRVAMINDDLGALRQVPQMTGQAAAQTLYEFVFDFFATNPTIYDGSALFVAGHSNLGSTALADAALDDRIFAMMDQSQLSNSKPLGITPKNIMVPNELARTAWEVTKSKVSSTSGRTETVPNWFESVFNFDEPIVVAYWTDATNWFLCADPAIWPTIEIGFLNGQEEPELFVQDQPTVGSVFTADKITYKIRHEYDGAVLDYRSLDGSVVAG